MIRESLKRGLAFSLWHVLGRRNLVRLGRFLSMEGRLDLNGDIYSNGEPMIRAVVAKHARDDRPLTVLDVGAHTGEWTEALLADCARAGRVAEVCLFEPSAATHRELRKRFEHHPQLERLTFERLALSRTAGTGTLHVVHELAGANSLHDGTFPTTGRETVELAAADEYVRRKKLDHVDLMKIDAEGHDLDGLTGARRLLEENKIEVVQFEYNLRWIDSRHFLKDAFELLLPLGYALGKVTRRGIEFYERWHPELETFRDANYLACTHRWVDLFPTLRWWNT